MDGTKFDEITEGLSAAVSRRRTMAGLLGGAALLTGALASLGDSEAKRGKRKGKGNGNGGGNGKGKAHGKNKVAICHKTDDGGFVLKRVPTPALKGHQKHGDVVCGEAGACQTGDPVCDATTGACTFAAVADDTECELSEGVLGHCEAGVCVENI